MHYLMAFDPSSLGLVRFIIFNNSEEALKARFEVEREENASINRTEVVVIGAPDLYTLMDRAARYFVNHDGGLGIEYCFFCRSHLTYTHSRNDVEDEQVDLLAKSSYFEGHCLFCHEAYPVSMRNPVGPGLCHLPENGLAYHVQQFCPVLSEIKVNP